MGVNARGPVLVATETADVTADMVITEINRRSVPVVRFNPADVGTDLTLSAWFGNQPTPVAGQLRTLSRTADLPQARAVYWRRPVWPDFPHLNDNDARFAAAQVRYGLGGALYAVEGPLWVNHPLRNAAADYKPVQLALAKRLGLSVPPTLVTNDPAHAREFMSVHRQVIHKTLRWTPYERDGVPVTGWTRPVTPDEIDDSLRVAPHLFQSRVDKTCDVRVLVVGRRVFAVRIDSGLLDWRTDYTGHSYSVVDLPGPLRERLLVYLDHLGLSSGSFDLAVDRAGRWWWLELNPNGQWGWLEQRTGAEMSAAFADLLIRGATA
ncbi:ATP-grasp ribosomal peptide maturase [Streptomyces sp. AJS327]|uniref:ATP-grasp ribosomal peptide maturase n=1 Tax=Streptomyces sp. AJS327 TaxID=2545265 RepID=UPI0015DFE35C|nr:ATP-grasp ribosomal peptide maturase [Streptomyces sp. AJS327]MBA0053192.1 ATP-grasp ribosomal peptide maturase [Streptomyces sp. AJS327]